MKINIRGNSAYLYRRHWVPVSADVPHAYPAEVYLGSISTGALSIPEKLLLSLTPSEQAQLIEKICKPAQAALDQLERKSREPSWRIAEAVLLLKAAAHCSQELAIHQSELLPIREALDCMQTIDDSPVNAVQAMSADPLEEALNAIRTAANAVRDGECGTAPVGNVRSTQTYQLWTAITEAVTGGGNSLLHALQDRGFVKKKQGV